MAFITNGKLMLAGSILGAALLVVPSAPASAGSRGNAAVAAGIIGVVASGIILQQHLNANRQQPKAKRAAKPSSREPTAATSSNTKDPFAGTGAPAGYATPVANKPAQ